MRDDRKKRTRSGPRVRDSAKRSRYLEGVKNVDPGDYGLLEKFVTEHGKIMPTRVTGATAKQQRQIKRGVRRARVMGLLP